MSFSFVFDLFFFLSTSCPGFLLFSFSFLSTVETECSVPVDAVTGRASYLVQNCMDGVDGRPYKDARRSGLVRYHDNDHFIFDVQMHQDRLTGVGGWARRSRHWGNKSAIGSSAAGTHLDPPFVRLIEKHDYERRLSVLMDGYGAGRLDLSKISPRLICFHRPLRTPFWISNFGSWASEIHFEVQMYTSERLPVFAGRKM